MKRILFTISILGLAAASVWSQQPPAKPAARSAPPKSNVITLEPSPKTIAWGHYDAASAPVLRVKSGDTVKVHTLLTNNPTRLAANNVPADQIEQALKDVYAEGDRKSVV